MTKSKMDFRACEEIIDLTGLEAAGMVVGRVSKRKKNPIHSNIQTEQCWQNRGAASDFQA